MTNCNSPEYTLQILCKEKIFAFLCKENDKEKAKKIIILQSQFLGYFGSKIPILEYFTLKFTFSQNMSLIEKNFSRNKTK